MNGLVNIFLADLGVRRNLVGTFSRNTRPDGWCCELNLAIRCLEKAIGTFLMSPSRHLRLNTPKSYLREDENEDLAIKWCILLLGGRLKQPLQILALSFTEAACGLQNLGEGALQEGVRGMSLDTPSTSGALSFSIQNLNFQSRGQHFLLLTPLLLKALTKGSRRVEFVLEKHCERGQKESWKQGSQQC